MQQQDASAKVQCHQVVGLIAGFVAKVLCCGSVYSWGLLYDSIQESLKISNLQTSVIFSLLFGLIHGAGLVVPSVMRCTDGRKLLMVSGTLAATSVALGSWAFNYWIFLLLFGFLQGLCQGIVYVAVPVVAATLLPESWSHIAIAIQNSGDGVGLFIFPIVYEILLDNYAWRQCCFIVAAILLHLVACAAVLPANSGCEKSGDAVYSVSNDNAQSISAKDGMLLDQILIDYSKQNVTISTKTGRGVGLARWKAFKNHEQNRITRRNFTAKLGLLRNINFLLLFFTSILDSIGYSMFYTFICSYLKSNNADLSHIATETLTTAGAVSVAGRLSVSIMNDKWIPRWSIFVMTHLLHGVSMLGFLYLPTDRGSILLSAILFGFTAGIGSSLLCCVCQDVCGHRQLPKVFSYSMFAWGIGSVTGPLVAGALKDLTGSSSMAISIGGCLFMCSGVILCSFYWTTKKTNPKCTPQHSKDNEYAKIVSAEIAATVLESNN